MELRVCEHPLDADSTWTMPGAYPGGTPKVLLPRRLQR